VKTPLLLALVLLAVPARADIRVLFANRAIAYGIDERVTWLGSFYGTGAPLGGPSLAVGPWFRAQLYASAPGTPGLKQPIGQPVDFRTGLAAGYVRPHEVVIPTGSVTGWVTVSVQMVAWCRILGETFEEAHAKGIGGWGTSQGVTVVGWSPDPQITIAPALIGLQAFSIHGAPGPVRLSPTEPATLVALPGGDGRLRHRFTGLRTGWLLNVETSTNLVHWRPWLQPWLPRGQGEFTFEVTADGPAQFFRGWQH